MFSSPPERFRTIFPRTEYCQPSSNPSGERRGKEGAEVLLEGREPDVLEGEEVLVASLLLAPSLGFPDEDPVGVHVAPSPEAVAFDEGLEEDGSEAVTILPVLRKASGGGGEEAGGEVFGSDPGKEEESGIVDGRGETGSGKGLVGEVVVALDEVVYAKCPVTFWCNSKFLQ